MNNPCATCPWLTENHGKRHPAGWYRASNLRRLWNGLRSGRAPGMICHSTDPRNTDYGGSQPVSPGHERECIGATTLIQRELTILEQYKDFRDYRQDRPMGFTRTGLGVWIEKIIFSGAHGKAVQIANPATCPVSLPKVPRKKNG